MGEVRDWAFTEEVRLAAVRAYIGGLGTQFEVCDAFECSRSSLGRWLRRHLNGESLAPSLVRGKPLPKLGDSELAGLKLLVDANVDKTYEQLAELYNSGTDLAVSRSTIMRGVWALGYTWKKKRFEHKNKTRPASRPCEPGTPSGSTSKMRSASSSSTSRGATSR